MINIGPTMTWCVARFGKLFARAIALLRSQGANLNVARLLGSLAAASAGFVYNIAKHFSKLQTCVTARVYLLRSGNGKPAIVTYQWQLVADTPSSLSGSNRAFTS